MTQALRGDIVACSICQRPTVLHTMPRVEYFNRTGEAWCIDDLSGCVSGGVDASSPLACCAGQAGGTLTITGCSADAD